MMDEGQGLSDRAGLEHRASALSQFRQALARGARLLSGTDPCKAKLFKRGLALIDRSVALRSVKPVSVFLTVFFLLGAFTPMLTAAGQSVDSLAPSMSLTEEGGAPGGSPDDFQLGAASANLTITTSTNKINVWTEEYAIKVDYSTSFIDYKICTYFSSDFIRYRRVNPYYAGDGTVDQNGNALDSVSMTISSWGRSGNTVWFVESCPQFSLNQTFRVYRDYFELDVTYKPGTSKVKTTYYIGLYSSSNSLYSLVNDASGRHNRYIPGYAEDTPDGYGFGGWYPSYKMYAPACDLRVPSGNLGVEWGYNETVAYLYSPLWLSGGSGGSSIMTLKYSSINSIVPNVGLGEQETFSMFVRPYKYTDGKQRGYDVGYAQWVAPKIASAWGNRNTDIFPLLVMDYLTWNTDFHTWVENSQVKVGTYSNNPNQINWNYKSAQNPNLSPDDPAHVPTSWQIYTSSGTPMTTSDGKAICNPVSGPATQSGTYRWNLIYGDPYMSWWTGTTGVFWDEVNLWTSDNKVKSDYQNRDEFLMDGYLKLIRESYESGYWSYVISNPYTAILHLSIASDLSLIEGYRPSSIYGIDMVSHVNSTMNFVNNIPSTYRPHIVVYQNYGAYSTNDQLDVYAALFGAAKYKYDVTIPSWDSYSAQMHNWNMAESMFKAMGCTRDSSVRTVTVDTLDLSQSTSLSTSAQMVVRMGSGKATITESSNLASFIITNLHATSNLFDLRVPGGGYFTAGSGAQSVSAMKYTSDGYATFSGSVDAEKTATITRNDNIQVTQLTSGTATVSLTSIGPSADLSVSATGGSTAITLKGFSAGKTYNILVNSVVVEQKVAASDGSITFTRAYGTNDRVQTQLTAADTVSPHVSSVSPANGAISVSVASQIRVTFNESMDTASTQGAFSLTGPSAVSGSFAWESGNTVLVFTPAQSLSYSTTYTVQVTPSAKDVAGNALSPSHSSTFSTEAQPVVIQVPSAPLSLAGTGGTRAVSLAWSAPSSNGGAAISGYKVYRGTASGGEGTTPIATLGNVTSYQDSGLADGTTYYYKVSAVNSAGEGAKSSEASASTYSVPGQPGTPTAIGGVRSVTLSWSAPSSNGGTAVTGYKVYRGLSSASLSLLTTLGNVLGYTDSALANGTTYYYKVSALNAIGEGAASSISSATTSVLAPSQVLDLRLTGSPSSIALNWTAPASNGGGAITNYLIYRGSTSGQLSLLATIGNVLSYVDQGLTGGSTYYYQVSALNSAGEGPRSTEASASTFSVPSQPGTLTAVGDHRAIALTWTAPSSNGGAAVSGYRIYRGTASNGQGLVPVAILGNVTSYQDSGLADGTTYYYKVSAVNSAGEGALSSEASASTTPAQTQPPSEPQGLTATGTDGTVRLEWDAPASDGGSSITAYCIYRAIGLGEPELVAIIAPSLGYDDVGLTNGVTYRYLVSAMNSVGEGATSEEVSATPLGLPGAPTNLQALPGNAKAALSWATPSMNGGSALTGYVIYRGSTPSTMTAVVTLGLVTSYEDLSLTNGQPLYYAVAAVNGVGEGAQCSSVSCVPGFVPSAPLSLSAHPSDSVIQLTWSTPISDNGYGITGYSVYRGLSSENLALLTTLGAVLSYSDAQVSNGQTYYYRVTASNDMGEGAFSSLASAKPATLPGAPDQLQSTGAAGKVDLLWSAPTDDGGDAVAGYLVFRGTSPSSLTQVASVGSTSYQDSGLLASTLYYYEVRAFNAVGNGPAAATSATTAGVPSAPTSLTAVADLDSATLSWTAPASDGGSAITGYAVYRGLSSSSLSLLATVTALTYLDTGLEPGTTYHYAVSAVNAVGEGARSGESPATTSTSAPSSPRNVKAQSGLSNISLDWDAPLSSGGAAIISYRIYRGTSSQALTYLAEAAGTEFVDSDAAVGQTFYYQVSAVNSVGEGAASSEVSAMSVSLPSAPLGVQTSKSKNSVVLTWSAPAQDGGASITSYVIYRGTISGQLTKLATVGAVLTYTDSTLPKANSVYYSVSAVNPAGEGARSDLAAAVLIKKASAPKNPTAVSQDGKILLSWEQPDDTGGLNITSYAVYRTSPDGVTTKVAEVNSTSLVDMGLSNGVTYAYSIAAINMVGEGNLTESLSAKPYGLPSSPPYLTATPYDGMILLEWDAPADDGGDEVSGYDIYAVDGTDERYLGRVSEDINSYVCNGLENGKSYVFRVAALNAAGQSERCSVVGTPVAAIKTQSAVSGDPASLGGMLTIAVFAAGAFASLFMVFGKRRSKARKSRQAAAAKLEAAKKPAAPVVVAQPRRVRAVAVANPAAAPRVEEIKFERTLRDLEVSNRII